jgi:hypothetical protein
MPWRRQGEADNWTASIILAPGDLTWRSILLGRADISGVGSGRHG